MGDVIAFRPRSVQEKPNQTRAQKDQDLSERIDRIKSSIARINQLMAELRGMADPPNTNR